MREGPTAVETREAAGAISCRHHWIIDSPKGPTSLGVCKYCGAREEFYNVAPDALWEPNSGEDFSLGRWERTPILSLGSGDDDLSFSPSEAQEVALVL